MIGTIVNTATIVAGASLGCLLKKNLPQQYQKAFFQVIGLFTLVLGMQMAFKMDSPSAALIIIFSMIAGTMLGEYWTLDNKMQSLGAKIRNRLGLKHEQFTEGFVSGFLLFAVGSMAIIGAIEEGCGTNPSTLLLTKSLMDGFSSFMLASVLGIGVAFSALTVLVFQGGITLAVYLIGGENIHPEIIDNISAAGGLMLLGLGITLLKIKRIRIVNMLPALIFVCLLVWLKITFLPNFR
ncbi:MAG: DUF554 domain-containing protein [Prevotellaceae bacterium]|jgi:uncharacterized membrane protein YqgA involved in biofilm formation|nr:DUF554 domain-containing protein [Prevotellaceae bacterium]